ncbi:DUF7857 domain-containing protein [Halomarina oriensis]|uniref:DUF8080 domain-containing protein n=1 Tax=Halomarina oriensis TaxID=671145 RepID=A0A6B0GLK5_9EURY|nr:hypothetical protein [Halomarina oriensis]MWG34597.1 hypothetical protein [Halomarina oriensis]
MNAEWTTRHCADRTLIEVTLTSDRPRRVRVEPTGDPTLHPPRTGGIPDAGWDDTGFSGVVDGRLGLGFAVTDPTDSPPVTVDWRGPPDDDPTFEGHPDVPRVEATTDGVLRTLSDPRPPRAALPTTATSGEATSATDREHGTGEEAERDASDRPTPERPSAATDGASPIRETSDGATKDEPSDDTPSTGVDLAAVERRLELAERLAAAETLTAASAAVAAAGGIDGVRALDGHLAADRDRLRALAERVETLGDRVDSVDLPVETLARIGGERP